MRFLTRSSSAIVPSAENPTTGFLGQVRSGSSPSSAAAMRFSTRSSSAVFPSPRQPYIRVPAQVRSGSTPSSAAAMRFSTRSSSAVFPSPRPPYIRVSGSGQIRLIAVLDRAMRLSTCSSSAVFPSQATLHQGSGSGQIRLVAVLGRGHALLDAEQQRGLPRVQARHVVELAQRVGEGLAVARLARVRQVLRGTWLYVLSTMSWKPSFLGSVQASKRIVRATAPMASHSNDAPSVSVKSKHKFDL